MLSLSLAASLTQANASNLKQKVSGFYFGETVGTSKLTTIIGTKYKKLHRDLSTHSDTSFQLLTGYQLNRVIAVELAYADFGSLAFDSGKAQFKPNAFTAQVNLGYTFRSGLRPFLLAGSSYLDLHQQETIYVHDTDISLRTGVGLEFAPLYLNGVVFRTAWTQDWSTTKGQGHYMLRNVNIGIGYKF